MMSAKRLSQEDRDDIYAELARHAFGERRREVVDARNKLSNLVYHNLYSAATIRKMRELPDGWLPTQTYVRVQIKGVVTQLLWPDPKDPNKTDNRLMFDEHKSGVVKQYDAGTPIAEAYEHWLKIKTQLENDETAARVEAMATLNRAVNLSRLIEMWPDIESITKKVFRGDTGTTLPVVAVDKLNERFKLPESKKSRSKA